MQVNKNSHTEWKDILFITIILGILFFAFLGSRPLLVPDGARYSEIAREMVVSGDYITPHLNGIKYFEKPVLFYWLVAGAIKIGGLNLWFIRSVNVILGIFGCVLTYFAGRKLYDRRTGLLSAFILGTSVLYFLQLHVVNLDLSVSVFLSGSLYLFLLAALESSEKTRRNYICLAFAMSGFAVLTKGLIGVVFPCMIVGLWIAIFNEWKLLKRLNLVLGIFVFLSVVLPWHVLVQLKNPEFFQFYFIKQHFLRYATMEANRYQPVWFFIPILLLGFAPWIVFLPQAIKSSLPDSWKTRFSKRAELFFLLWVVVVFAFFSFSHSKLIPYILPMMPPLALLTARYLMQGFCRGIKVGFVLLMVFAFLLAVFLCLLTSFYFAVDPYWANVYLFSAAGVILIGMRITYGFQKIGKLNQALISLVATSGVFLVLLLAAVPYVDDRSIQPLTQQLKPVLNSTDEVVAYKKYYQDLPFYLERKVTVVDWRSELDFGMQHQDASQWMIDEKTFWQRWQGKNRMYVLMTLDNYEILKRERPREILRVVAKTRRDVLVVNQLSQ